MRKFKLDLSNFKLEFHSLKTKLIIFVCAMSLIMISTLAIVNYISLSKGISSTVDEMIVPLNTESASDVSSKITMLKAQSETALLRTISSDVVGVASSTKSAINYQLGKLGIDASAFVLYKSGEAFTWSDKFPEDKFEEIRNSDIFTQAMTTKKTCISDPVTTADGTSAEFTIAAYAKGSVTTYILVLYLDVDALSSIVNSVQFGETGHVYLINKDGRTIADNDLQKVIDGFNANELAQTDSSYSTIAGVHELALAGESGSTTGMVDGIMCQIAYAPVADSDWAVVLVAPEKEFKEPLSISTKTIVVFSVAMLILVFICTIIIMNGVVNPVIKVTARLKSLSDGDLATEVEKVAERNEVGVLASSLDTTVHSLRSYIDEISDALVQISEGNLAFEMNGEFKGDFVKIKNSFNSILAQLRRTFEKISLAANQVSDGASQVASGAQLLSAGAVQQSEAITTVSDQIEDIAQHIESTAGFASGTGELVDKIELQIDSCNKEMNKMLSSMDDISKSSAQISEIIQVIDDIAFQTNILALNAAVEAARAGDAGLGFAVVADEVRNLANMSADAAKQTSMLIEDSIRNVKHGTAIARTTAESLNKIVASASEINEKVKDVESASKRQNQVVSTIRDSVMQVTAVIDNTSSTAEQSAATAEQMSGQAGILREMIDRFKYEIDFDDSNYLNMNAGAEAVDTAEEAAAPETSDENAEQEAADEVFEFLCEEGAEETVSEAETQETAEAAPEEKQEETADESEDEAVYYEPNDSNEFTPIDFSSYTDEDFKHHDGDKY
ncbi:MAG: methyl-accepting chemotaxis protein [Oscillospiraceae bacterium]|nr:methyl-accepting chemotaxis protein [Oscillospiraceae bacterium]